LFARKFRRYLEELVLDSDLSDIVINSTFDRDSVVAFTAACEGADFSLTQSNVFEIELLCDEWSVAGKSIRHQVTEFIRPRPLAFEIPSAILFRVIGFKTCEGGERNTNGCLHFASNI
jgi:hypothetical protein